MYHFWGRLKLDADCSADSEVAQGHIDSRDAPFLPCKRRYLFSTKSLTVPSEFLEKRSLQQPVTEDGGSKSCKGR